MNGGQTNPYMPPFIGQNTGVGRFMQGYQMQPTQFRPQTYQPQAVPTMRSLFQSQLQAAQPAVPYMDSGGYGPGAPGQGGIVGGPSGSGNAADNGAGPPGQGAGGIGVSGVSGDGQAPGEAPGPGADGGGGGGGGK
jgi:hypothetical protein